MKDGPVRRAVKWAARTHAEINLRLSRALASRRGERAFELRGACQGCGTCCEAPTIQVGRVLWYSPLARSAFLWWQRTVNGFELVSREVATRSFVFACAHFDPIGRRCDSYSSRPWMCRDYPRALLFQADPELFPGCGYRPVAPHAERLLQILDAQALSAEQRANLERGLRLER